MPRAKPAARKAAARRGPAAARRGPAAPGGDEPFAAIVAACTRKRGVTYGKLMASNGLRVNGKIFAMLVRGRLVVKLPRARVDALVEAGEARRFEPGLGRVMKEWAEVEPARAAVWRELADEAFAFVKATA